MASIASNLAKCIACQQMVVARQVRYPQHYMEVMRHRSSGGRWCPGSNRWVYTGTGSQQHVV